jgi:hypothetical protein
MKMTVHVSQEQEFTSSTWWAKTAEFALETLKQQLDAASAIWPELKEYKIEKRRKR